MSRLLQRYRVTETLGGGSEAELPAETLEVIDLIELFSRLLDRTPLLEVGGKLMIERINLNPDGGKT